MSAFRKLFIAAALLATGLGVAHLLGEPVSIKQALDPPRLNSQAPPATVASAQSAPATTWAANRVQLLPDSVVTQNSVSAAEAPSLQSPLAPIPSVPIAYANSQFTQSVAVNDTPATPRYGSATPRANLRNEAPRPIGNEPRSPATIRRTPPVTQGSGDSAGGTDAYNVTTPWPASPQLLPAAFTSDGNSTAATAAAYDMPGKITDNTLVAPPWPARDETSEPRTHLIVDGDSLEKLAGRYLDDPHRSAEIFALNREVLSSPDLLPIGAELKIPERTTRTSWDRQSRRAGFPNDASVREAASGNLVPVRPISSYDGVVPRAQLARPVAVE